MMNNVHKVTLSGLILCAIESLGLDKHSLGSVGDRKKFSQKLATALRGDVELREQSTITKLIDEHNEKCAELIARFGTTGARGEISEMQKRLIAKIDKAVR